MSKPPSFLLRSVVIGAGSNVGPRRSILRRAHAALDARGLRVLRRSRLYETPALTLPGAPPQDDFLNAAFLLRTRLSPRALLAQLHAIERSLGRERPYRWAPRTLDLDVLWMEGVQLDEPASARGPALTIPHPGLRSRNFALRPLLDVMPELAPLYARDLRRGAPRAVPWIAVDEG